MLLDKHSFFAVQDDFMAVLGHLLLLALYNRKNNNKRSIWIQIEQGTDFLLFII
jgi:hypothetical protein